MKYDILAPSNVLPKKADQKVLMIDTDLAWQFLDVYTEV